MPWEAAAMTLSARLSYPRHCLLARGITLSVITIIGASAIAGATGAGGLGAVALRYGYQRFMEDVLIYTVLLMVIIVQAIQMLGDFFCQEDQCQKVYRLGE